MRIKQDLRHWAAKRALTAPIVGEAVRSKLVSYHTDVFADRADEAHRAKRRERLRALFEATMDSYVAALQAGLTEAEAREITHIQANFDFYNHGWTEMMEIPTDELDAHYERYADFFGPHGITIADPLGAFAPAEGLPEAPATPDRLDDPEHPHAEGGFADDVYVETADGETVIGGGEEPDDVPTDAAPGIEE
ncbi:MAG: DUF6149 family protein [Halococcoides sp.]